MTVAVPPPDPAATLVEVFAGSAAEHDRNGSFPHGNLAGRYEAGLALQQRAELCGTAAHAQANPLERHLRDVLRARIHRPQGDAVRAAGRTALGR
ncbi:hypothetical protein GCM10007886_37610 [Methylobacterium gregans]|uniref:Uncharacterized protein n=1 Tax=Methylobacterium gregans TaxID=374424 RepID=A0AA37HLV4_9HYPH|nr:hypothetical protein [Methylobacterium gregans]GJD78207.1 hypothetical protein NBEOAGPD_1421 [Methylobacterium gregans]GLS55576.1 hypothetical protein GCM10007886_37610 [Methylobacterium gregans]